VLKEFIQTGRLILRNIVLLGLNYKEHFMSRKNILLSLLASAFLLFASNACSNKSGELKKIQAVIDSISVRHIPDRRLALSTVQVNFEKDNRLLLKGECSVAALHEELINALGKSNKVLIDSIVILPDTLREKKNFGIVNLSVINIRSKPAESAELVSQALLGTPVKIMKFEAGWYFIQTPDGYLGWAEELSLIPVDVNGLEKWRHSSRLLYMGNSGSVYSRPDMKSIVSDIVLGCIIEREGGENGTAKVVFPDGRRGYIPEKEVVDFDKWRREINCTQEGIMDIAGRLTGLPYLWGGTSSKGVDCSGFSKTVYFLNGIILQRDASQQALHGEFVDISNGYGNLRPGDLLFFGPKRNGKPRVTHVAIYIADNEYINSSGLVTRNSLDPSGNDYNQRESLLLSARRIIGVKADPGIVNIRDHPWY
jgi:gamma-D-glutamyl-L-lysine dipeptidyl-peptidase